MKKEILMHNMLQDVVTHFSKNPIELRSVTRTGHCLYRPNLKIIPKSIGCAIGMYVSWDIAGKLDRSSNMYGNSILCILGNNKKKLLPKWMIKLPVDFLSKIQSLHDTGKYWEENDISEYGKIMVENITNEFKLPKITFNKK